MRDLSLSDVSSQAPGSVTASAARLTVKGAGWRANRVGRTILHPISLELAPGRVLGIVGPNGAGKSTFLRLLYRYLRPTSGSIELDGVDLWSSSARDVARQVAAVLQEQPTDFALTVHEIVDLGRTPHRKGLGGMMNREDAAVVNDALDRLDLGDLANRRLGTLSGGERQRVMAARALAQEPRLLILDEPTNHLDIRHQLEVLALIRELPLTIVTSLHDLNMATQVCDEILLLRAGHPLGLGEPQAILTEGAVSDAFSVTARQERLSPSDMTHLTFHL